MRKKDKSKDPMRKNILSEAKLAEPAPKKIPSLSLRKQSKK